MAIVIIISRIVFPQPDNYCKDSRELCSGNQLLGMFGKKPQKPELNRRKAGPEFDFDASLFMHLRLFSNSVLCRQTCGVHNATWPNFTAKITYIANSNSNSKSILFLYKICQK